MLGVTKPSLDLSYFGVPNLLFGVNNFCCLGVNFLEEEKVGVVFFMVGVDDFRRFAR